MDSLNDVGYCDFCDKIKINKTYCVYRIDFTTNLGDYNIGILAICEELADYLMKIGIHLSATQVILLRPDMMLEFLRRKYNTPTETVKEYSLAESEICYTCYQDYIEHIPLR